MKLQLLILSLFSISLMSLSSQNLKKYQWKNRVLLIISDDSTTVKYNTQIKVFNENAQGLKERRLIIYSVLANTYKILSHDKSHTWIKDVALYEQFNSDKNDFKIILIGLDGAIKIEQNEVLNMKELFSAIDSMPMRRAELKNLP